MDKAIELGIGFVTGRANVCNIINSYYKDMLKQVSKMDRPVNITLFILYDLNYQETERIDFYQINHEVYKYMDIEFITPENIEEEKKRIIAKTNITRSEMNMFLGNGHAKGRNTLMYYAYRDNMDYLLFWDDDEYPYACIKGRNRITWKHQDNIKMHLKNIENKDVTVGYHCGYISPIPYVNFETQIEEEKFKNYIEAVSNDIISWESIKNKMQKDNGVTFAKSDIAMEKECMKLKKKDVVNG